MAGKTPNSKQVSSGPLEDIKHTHSTSLGVCCCRPRLRNESREFSLLYRCAWEDATHHDEAVLFAAVPPQPGLDLRDEWRWNYRRSLAPIKAEWAAEPRGHSGVREKG